MLQPPIIDYGAYVSLPQFVALVITMLILVVVIGYRNHVAKPAYWAVSIIQVAVLAVFWIFFAEFIMVAVMTYLFFPREVQLMIVDAARIIMFLGFCGILVAIESYRGRRMRESKHDDESP